MDHGQKITHYYHANADAFGGTLERPISSTLPVLGKTSLPVVGGYTSAQDNDFEFGEIISIGKAFSQVSGSFDARKELFRTVVTSSIEGVNIAGQLTADRIAVQIVTEHPLFSYYPRVVFAGTEYVGLRVAGFELSPMLNLNVCDHDGEGRYPTQSCLYNPGLREFAREQSEFIANRLAGDSSARVVPAFERLFNLHSGAGPNSDDEIRRRGNVICSVVETIEVPAAFPGKVVGNVVELPDFGRIHLGELIVDHNAFDLTMLRLDLGCNTQGKASGGHGGANGTNSGPG